MVYLIVFLLVAGIISLGILGIILAILGKGIIRSALAMILSLCMLGLGIYFYYKSNLSTKKLEDIMLQANKEFSQLLENVRKSTQSQKELQDVFEHLKEGEAK